MEEIPFLQQQIIKEVRHQGKFCIVATEMLESMKKNSRPTRAEVSDIANAVLNGTDAVMLSGETTTGKFPAETVKFMSDICEKAEVHIQYGINTKCITKDIPGAIATSIVETSNLLDPKLIVTATMSGTTARQVSNLRPKCPILATCTDSQVARHLALNFGVYPVVTNVYNSTDEIIIDSKAKALDFMEMNPGDLIVVSGGFPNTGVSKTTNFMKIEKI